MPHPFRIPVARLDTPAYAYDIEASDLGWAPGHWPEVVTIVLEKVDVRLTERRPLNGRDEEFRGYEYRTVDGSTRLTVWND